jgi:hypothetical protein
MKEVVAHGEEGYLLFGRLHSAQVRVTPMGGGLRDHFQTVGSQIGLPYLGYSAIFGIAFVYFVLGSVLVRKVKGPR